MSNSLWHHELQHARLPCPLLTPVVGTNSNPLSQGRHPTFSSSVAPFFSCPQSFPASGELALFHWVGSSHQWPKYWSTCAKSLQSCPTLCDPMDHSTPGSSVHGILYTRILVSFHALFHGIFLTQGSNCMSFISYIGRQLLYSNRAPPGKPHWSINQAKKQINKTYPIFLIWQV